MTSEAGRAAEEIAKSILPTVKADGEARANRGELNTDAKMEEFVSEALKTASIAGIKWAIERARELSFHSDHERVVPMEDLEKLLEAK